VLEKSQQSTERALGDASAPEIVERFVNGFERGDVKVIVDPLVESAGSALPPNPRRGAVTPTIRATVSLPRFGLPSKLAA
jgi:hypothetical protein